jgi:hypothetical protein
MVFPEKTADLVPLFFLGVPGMGAVSRVKVPSGEGSSSR